MALAVDFRLCGVSSSLVGGKKGLVEGEWKKSRAFKNKVIRAHKLPPEPSSSVLQKIPQYDPR